VKHISSPFCCCFDIFSDFYCFDYIYVVNSLSYSYIYVFFFIHFYFLAYFLLLLSGDVELNPGPARQFVKKTCSILAGNVRGLRGNYLDLLVKAKKFDLILLSETLTTKFSDSSELLVPGFCDPILRLFGRIPNARGLVAYIRLGSPIFIQKHLECRCHELFVFKMYGKFMNFYIVFLYRNPNPDNSIYDCLLNLISVVQLSDHKARFVITGDCNAHHSEWLNSRSPTNASGRAALDFHNTSSLDQIIDFPTHVLGNTLDLLFTDVSGIVSASDFCPIGSSDHSALKIDLRFQHDFSSPSYSKSIWLKSRANWDLIREDFSAVDWGPIYSSVDSVDRLNEELLRVFSTHIPKRNISVNSPSKPWFNRDCTRACNDKQAAYHRWSSNRTVANWDSYIETRRFAQHTYAAALKSFNILQKEKLDSISQPHAWWSCLKSNLFGDSSGLPPLLAVDGQLLTDPSDKATRLAEVFDSKQCGDDCSPPCGPASAPKLVNFAFKSSLIRTFLRDLDPFGGEDPNGFLPLMRKLLISLHL
jgi:hypothetical protein